MVTTTRRSSEISSTYEPAKGGVALLERPSSYSECASAMPVIKEDMSEEKARRQSNLDKLLNYDRYSEVQASIAEAESKQQETVVNVIDSATLAEEDIRPTSTTMQFGDDIDQIRREINQKQEVASETYHLNKKGKVVISLYALVVTVILALIVLNTGVLAKLSNVTKAKAEKLNATIARYDALQAEISAMTDSDYIISVAENQYGMVRK